MPATGGTFMPASGCGSTSYSYGKCSSPVWSNDEGQDIAEYAVSLAANLVLVVGTVRLIGSNTNNVFSQTASSINQQVG
jgi:hypothetical protein